MSIFGRVLTALCLALFVTACAPKPEPVVYTEPAVTVEPTYTGKL
jgi:PBP1b-binding outer membrane lipoprotein LpoB